MSIIVNDLLIRIKNGYMAGNKSVIIPFSKIGEEICKILKKEQYIKDYLEEQEDGKKSLVIELLYEGNVPAVRGISLISRPGRRMYGRLKDLKPVLSGLGILVLSSPMGILTGKEAFKKKTGGELLFKIW